jgi:hypothetical protein
VHFLKKKTSFLKITPTKIPAMPPLPLTSSCFCSGILQKKREKETLETFHAKEEEGKR